MSSEEIVKALRRGLFSNTLLQMAADKIEELENKVERLSRTPQNDEVRG
jgi:hypothetical protein